MIDNRESMVQMAILIIGRKKKEMTAIITTVITTASKTVSLIDKMRSKICES